MKIKTVATKRRNAEAMRLISAIIQVRTKIVDEDFIIFRSKASRKKILVMLQPVNCYRQHLPLVPNEMKIIGSECEVKEMENLRRIVN